MDKTLECERPIHANSRFVTGDKVFMDKESDLNKTTKRYILSIRKNIIDLGNQPKLCRKYPNRKYKSYRDCEHHFIHKSYKNFGNLNPLWAKEEAKEISGKTFLKDKPYNEREYYYDLVNGILPTNCRLPCTTHSIDVVHLESHQASRFISNIDFILPPIVQVSRTRFAQKPPSSLLAEFGGCMGLWLGLGAAQALHTCFIFCRKLFDKNIN